MGLGLTITLFWVQYQWGRGGPAKLRHGLINLSSAFDLHPFPSWGRSQPAAPSAVANGWHPPRKGGRAAQDQLTIWPHPTEPTPPTPLRCLFLSRILMLLPLLPICSATTPCMLCVGSPQSSHSAPSFRVVGPRIEPLSGVRALLSCTKLDKLP